MILVLAAVEGNINIAAWESCRLRIPAHFGVAEMMTRILNLTQAGCVTEERHYWKCSILIHCLCMISLLPECCLPHSKMPELEEIARNAADELLHRSREEAIRIAAATELKQLIALMKIRPDPLNHLLLISRVLEFENAGVMRLCAELKEKQNTPFVELALKIVYRSGFDYSQEMEALIRYGPRRAYLVALMCMILGMRGQRKHAKLLWDYYHMLRERFAEEAFSDGPLIGLKEIVDYERQLNT